MNKNIYESYSVNKLIFTFSFPAIFSLIIETMTSVVDTSFAGHLGNQSESALSAIGLLSPLLAIFVALQTLFAISTAILISKYLGRSDNLKLNKYFQSGFIMTLIVSIGTSLIVLFFMEPLLLILGAKEEVYMLANDYLKIILLSNIFSSMGYTLTSSIRAFGKPNAEAIIITLSVVINIIFNAILTFGFQLGITGIALGTLISELVCAFISVFYLVKNKLWFSTTRLSIKDHLFMSYKMFKIGFAQTTIQMLAGVSAFIVNHQLITIGGNSHISVWNIANKMYILMLMPIIGITQAVQTIIAYYDGKEELAKKNMTVRKTIHYSFIYGIGITIVIYMFGNHILHLFSSNMSILVSTMDVVRVIFITFPLIGITYTIMTLLQVTGREIHAIILGITRQVITVVPLVILLPYIFSKQNILNISPAFSIFFSIPLADIFTLGIAIVFYRKLKK